MFDLLFAPLKKGRKTANQLRIFFKVMGREFDDLKAAIFRVRNEANISCSEVMLPVHGQDRDMPRLEGEDAEAYRTRLSMKGINLPWSGTRRSICLHADRARLRPQPDRAVRRAGRGTLGRVHHLSEQLQAQRRHEPLGHRRASPQGQGGQQQARLRPGNHRRAHHPLPAPTGFSRYPRCGEIVCGVWPHIVSEGRLVVSTVMAQGGAIGGDDPSREPAHLQPPRSSITSERTPFYSGLRLGH